MLLNQSTRATLPFPFKTIERNGYVFNGMYSIKNGSEQISCFMEIPKSTGYSSISEKIFFCSYIAKSLGFDFDKDDDHWMFYVTMPHLKVIKDLNGDVRYCSVKINAKRIHEAQVKFANAMRGAE